MKGGLLARLAPELAKTIERPKVGLLGRIPQPVEDDRPAWRRRDLKPKDMTGVVRS